MFTVWKDFDCYNIAQFCTAFIDETMEDAWTAAGNLGQEPKYDQCTLRGTDCQCNSTTGTLPGT